MMGIDYYFPLLAQVAKERGLLAELLPKHQSAIAGGSTGPVAAALARLALAFPRKTMADLFPRIVRCPEIEIADGPLKVRTSNVLAKRGITTWGHLGQITIEKIFDSKNAGRVTVRDILELCCRLSYEVLDVPNLDGNGGILSDSKIDSSHPSGLTLGVGSEIVSAIALVAAWAVEVKGARTVGDILDCNIGNGGFPVDVSQAWTQLRSMQVGPLGGMARVERDVNSLVRELLAGLNDKERVAFELRVLANDPPILEEVGDELEVTRERARQLQEKAEAKISLKLTERRYSPIGWRVAELRRELGYRACLQSPCVRSALKKSLLGCDTEMQHLLRALLLHVAGPYREDDGWLVRADAPLLDIADLEILANEHGVLPLQAALGWLEAKGVDREGRELWLRSCPRLRLVGEQVLIWSGSVVDKCVAQLAARGSPIAGGELMALVGEDYSARATMTKLISDPRIMRTSKLEVGLREWGLEEYSGIAIEIAQRIESAEGRVHLDDIVRELVERFGVRESSVRAYAAAPMFVLDEGWIRIRRDDESYVVGGDIAQGQGVFQVSEDEWSINIVVDGDTVRGSGRSFSPLLAARLGVDPGGIRQFNTPVGPLKISWPTTQFAPSIGSLRALSAFVRAEQGDFLQLHFDVQREEALAVRVERTVISELDPLEAVRLLTGLQQVGPDVERSVARAIGVRPQDARRVLSQRGDGVLSDLLSHFACVEGAELDDALAEFGRALEMR